MDFQLSRTLSSTLTRCTICLIACALTSGCDSGPATGRVTGAVTYDGEAVEEGTVTFYPTQGGRPATGKIQSDGTYELCTYGDGDGAFVGNYRIAIEAKSVVGGPPAPKSLQEEITQTIAATSTKPSIKWLVPEQYSSAESSGLTAAVKRGQNEIHFNLP